MEGAEMPFFRIACAALALLCASEGAGARIVFSLDYSLDTSGLFDAGTASGRSAQTAMDRAAQVFSDRFIDSLTAITPGGANTWSARIRNPGTGADSFDPSLFGVAANVIKVYVGSRSLTLPEVGSTAAGAALAIGSQTFLDNAASRGQPGALANPKTDYGPWGGSIAFDIDTNWYFGLTAGGLTSNKIDFLTVATHELAHLLGFSASQPSWAALVSNGKFTGPKATAANANVQPTVSGSHWLNMNSPVGLNGPTQVALMDAGVPTGVRRRMTLLDWAALGDVGWQVATPGDANADGLIDIADFQAFELNFGQTNARWSQGDFNEDGAIDTADFALLMKNYARQQGGAIESASEINVPEPQVWGLMLLGTLILRACDRRGGARTSKSS
jgi:hypothetical protein